MRNRTMVKIAFYTLLLFLLTACVTEDQPENVGVTVGDPLPQFSVALNDGRIVSTATLRGKRVLIELFNTDCPDCRENLPVINQVYEAVKDREDVEVFAIARSEEEPSIDAFWKEHDMTLPYSPQPDREVYELFASVGIPRVYIADSQGIITAYFGPEDNPSLQLLLSLLN